MMASPLKTMNEDGIDDDNESRMTMVVVEIKRLQHPNKAGLAYHCGDLNALKGFQPGLPHINIRNQIANIIINSVDSTPTSTGLQTPHWQSEC